MIGAAYAKVNLALAVNSPSADGYHPLRGLFQSVSLADTIEIVDAERDEIVVSNDEVPSDDSNIAWKALDAMRRVRRLSAPMRLSITKRIPAGAGLGGGSADAAAVIGLMANQPMINRETTNEIAASLGSDVPFSMVGGTAVVRGRGELIDKIEPLTGFALDIVVPPFPLLTPAVFKEWDRLGGPVGDAINDPDLPPVLRGGEPMRNDLLPAAVSLEPRLGDWMDEIGSTFGLPISMTGSGSGLFAYFATAGEAADAALSLTLPARAIEAVTCVGRGWEPLDA